MTLAPRLSAVVVWLALTYASTRALDSATASAQRTLLDATPHTLVVDRDDSDDDGTADLEQRENVPTADAAEVVIPAHAADVSVSVLGGLRVLRHGQPVETPFTLKRGDLPAPLWLQAREPSSGSRPLALLLTSGGETQRHSVHAVELNFLDARNQPLRPARDPLSISYRVTSDASLPRTQRHGVQSPDPRNIRVQIDDAAATGMRVAARIESVAHDGSVRHSQQLTLVRSESGEPFRSRFVRLVGDHVDLNARGVSGQVLLVALRDTVRVVYETGGGMRVSQAMRVGRPGDEEGEAAARYAPLRVFVLRAAPGGAPVIGTSDASALAIVREEIASANEIWLQCHITFGAPAEAMVELADPPQGALIAVANRDGLPARGGTIHLLADGRPLPPVEAPAGASAIDTALRIARAAQALGFHPQVTVNPKTVFGAAPSADVLLRRRNGSVARVERVGNLPLTTDPQQRIDIGSVDLGDGLEEFDNMTAASGTLEERTLIKALADDDPTTVDLFIINRFSHGTRQGEAFIEASAGPIKNAVILDRTGLRHRETAWTMAHELGHVLLNQPLHPDNVGRDRPWLLMDADNNRGTVNGPKRLSPEECAQARNAKGGGGSILKRYAER